MATTQHNYKPKSIPFTGISQTVPGQSAPIALIRERFSRGQGVKTYPGVYNPDVPPDVENLDFMDRKDLARQIAVENEQKRLILRDQEERRKRESVQKPTQEMVFSQENQPENPA